MGFTSLITITAIVFLGWHLWRYDGFRCLIPTKRDWFRSLMVYMIIAALSCFTVYSWIQAEVLYREYYISISGSVIPKPWQLWSELDQHRWRVSLYVVCMGWCTQVGVHLEEFLYWGYLIASIRYPLGPRTTWVGSIYFKIWVGAFLACFPLLFGAVSIETENLDYMRAYLFTVGGALSIGLAIASTVLVYALPPFIAAVKAQGAPHDALDRLIFFDEMNGIRTVFRWGYGICFLILAADGLTTHKVINKSNFWSDFIFVLGQMSIFISTCLSLVLLLPRNMTSESLPTSTIQNRYNQAHRHHEKGFPADQAAGMGRGNNDKMRMVPYTSARNRPHTITTPQAQQYQILGERLNLDQDAMRGLAENNNDNNGIELSPNLNVAINNLPALKKGLGGMGKKNKLTPRNASGSSEDDTTEEESFDSGPSSRPERPKRDNLSLKDILNDEPKSQHDVRGVRFGRGQEDEEEDTGMQGYGGGKGRAGDRGSKVWVRTETVTRSDNV